jgi:hypothetical protein
MIVGNPRAKKNDRQYGGRRKDLFCLKADG